MTQPLTLGAAVGMLLAGVVEAGDTRLSAALFAAGFVTLGIWLAVDIINRKDT